MKNKLLILVLFAVSILKAQNYGQFQHYADINFENGTVSDSLGNANTILQNGATIIDDSVRGGKVVFFDSSQKGNIKFNNSPLNDKITITFWFKREDADSTANWRAMFAFYAADGSNVYFSPKTSWGNSSYLIYNNSPFSIFKTATGNTVINNTWIHYAIVFDDNLMKVYQNGEYISSANLFGKLSNINSIKWFLGNNPELNYPMTGKMDDVKIFHSVLANNQIKAIFENKVIPAATDDVKPFVNIPLDVDCNDTENNVITNATNVTITSDAEKGKVGFLSSNARITLNSNPFGSFKYTLAMMLKKDNFTSENNKYIYKAIAANGDYFGLRLIYASNKALIDLVSFKNDTLIVLGTSSTSYPLNANQWNSIILVQTDTVAIPAVKLYINGVTAFIKTDENLNTYDFNSWHIGSNDSLNLSAKFDAIKIYQREIPLSEVANYHNSQVNTTDIYADYNNRHQTIKNFGASDGFFTKAVGVSLSEAKKDELAELLFSKEKNIDGTPKGIGLSAWRFNIGAGTFEQGEASRITVPEKRTECFLNADGTTYNWDKQAGQRWFLEKAATNYKVPYIIGWQNSPPVRYTVRGLGFREYGDPKQSILQTQHYNNFGNFLADVVLHFEQEGIIMNYISPLNEPQHDWMPDAPGAQFPQEGSPWTNTEISNVVKAISNRFVAKNVKAKLFLGEAGAISSLLSGTGVATNQLAELWTPTHANYIGNVTQMSNIVSSHSYFNDTSADVLVNTRQTLKDRMTSLNPNLEFWETEYSLLETGYKFGHPDYRLLTPMECAISLARVIHADLAVANASAWQWWSTFGPDNAVGTEDRFALIRYALNSSKTEGIYQTTKLLYALGNFSHFIRPGMKRLEISRSDNMNNVNSINNLMVSAYLSGTDKEIVFVVINPTSLEKGINLFVNNLLPNTNISEFTPYITTENDMDNLKKYPSFSSSDRYILPANSIITFVGKINKGSENHITFEEETEANMIYSSITGNSAHQLQTPVIVNNPQIDTINTTQKCLYVRSKQDIPNSIPGWYGNSVLITLKDALEISNQNKYLHIMHWKESVLNSWLIYGSEDNVNYLELGRGTCPQAEKWFDMVVDVSSQLQNIKYIRIILDGNWGGVPEPRYYPPTDFYYDEIEFSNTNIPRSKVTQSTPPLELKESLLDFEDLAVTNATANLTVQNAAYVTNLAAVNSASTLNTSFRSAYFKGNTVQPLWWHGLHFTFRSPVDAGDSQYLHIMMKKDRTEAQNVQVSLVNPGGTQSAALMSNPLTTEWVDYVMQIPSTHSIFTQMYIKFNAATMNTQCYADEIYIDGSSAPRKILANTMNNSEKQDYRLYAEHGNIHFNTDTDRTVNIYNMSGQKLYSYKTSALTWTAPVKGLYIVCVDATAHKLIVY